MYNVTFAVQGQQFQSDRHLPGFFANHGKWTGGSAVAAEYRAGQAVTVNYSSTNPYCCALEYGWFKASVAFTAIIWGMVAAGVAQKEHGIRHFGHWVLPAGVASLIYGFALLFFGPVVVRPVHLHWHTLVWWTAFVIVLLYHRFHPGPARDTEAEKLVTVDAAEE